MSLELINRFNLSKVGANTLVNIAGKSASSLLGLFFVPLYIRHLGVEAWGIVGFQLTLQVVFSLLELGMPASVSREVSCARAAGNYAVARNILQMSELLMGVVGFVLAILIGVAAGFLSDRWLSANHLSPNVMVYSIRIIGVMIFTNLVTMLYAAGLVGADCQVSLNIIQLLSAVLRGGASIGVLVFTNTGLIGYFWVQLIMAVLTGFLLRYILYSRIGREDISVKAMVDAFFRIRRFAASMTLNNILQTVVVQSDKLTISKILPLSSLGAYSIAGTLTSPLNMIAGAVSLATYPELCTSFAQADNRRFAGLHFNASLILAWTIWPMAALLCFFGQKFIELWLNNLELANIVHVPLAVMAFSCGISALNQQLNQMQLARGATSLILKATFIHIIVLLPSVIYLSFMYGLVGAAAGQLIGVVSYFVFIVSRAHSVMADFSGVSWMMYCAFLPVGVSYLGVFCFSVICR